MNIPVLIPLLTAGALLLPACRSHSILEQPTESPRARFGEQILAAEPMVEVGRPDSTGSPYDVFIESQNQGTWTFTTPPSVTRVERKNADMDQFSLYMGRPQPTDTPFLVITVSNDRQSTAESEPETYQIGDHREYVMNGGIVQEWTGRTKQGAGFSELIIRKPGRAGETGDVCHAMAIARTPEEHQIALSILSSIIFKPMRE